MKTPRVPPFVVVPHALFESSRRGIDLEIVRSILAAPEQRLTVRPGRVVLQSRIAMGTARRWYLVRVVVDVDRSPAEVVTVYRTTRIAKYWKGER